MIYAENIIICIAIPLIITLIFIGGGAGRFVKAFITGMVICLLAAYISGYLESISGLGAEDASIFISPIVEEIMKYLPILFFMLVFNSDGNVLILMSIGVGAGFATFENCCYILSSGADNLTYILIRGMAVGVMHIVSIFALTLALVLLRRLNVSSYAGMAGALSLSITFHSLYNLLVSEPGISSVIGYCLPIAAAVTLGISIKKENFYQIGE